ncbi:Ornithine decarboxylase antizyme 1 [Armadillidium nasatum]|uniref:Ornithine decarboxylase antizyme n=1 Tax=Armadillidium nasatum TaxID=96803 RepID=A0A5N5T746_9CRUS|nr:Ornithine decarboxylase antizyme 1 [Armadillidium nasatum]
MQAVGLGGGFDAPHAANVSISSTEGSGVGSLIEPPVAGSCFSDPVSESDVLEAIESGSVRLSLEFHLAEQTTVVWETVVLGRNLYLYLGGSLPKGSKEAFVSLLEYAEEALGCSNVIVCFKKDRADRALLIRTFMFLGFQPIPPGHPLVPGNGDLFYMMYEID